MPGIQGLIQTIIQLQNLKAQQQAQELARERFGLEQRQTNAGILGNVINALPGYQHPSDFVAQNSDELSQLTGASPQLLASAASQTPPAVQTVRAGAVARGAQSAGTEADVPAYFQGVAGMTPGATVEDRLMGQIFGGASSELNDMPPEKRTEFFKQALSKHATGMSLGDAVFDTARTHLSPEEVAQAAKIGAGLAPTATADAQIKLGYFNSKIEQMHYQMQAAEDELRLKLELESHKGTLDAQAFKEADDLIKARAQFLTDAARTSGTLTPEGYESYRAQVNAFNNQLRRVAPGIYGPGGPSEIKDIPQGKGVAPTGGISGLFQFLTRKQ